VDEMVRITVLSTVFPYGNKGDEAIYKTSIELIRRYCPKCDISLSVFSTPGFEPDRRLLWNLYGIDNIVSHPADIFDTTVKRFFGKRENRLKKLALSVNRFFYWDLSPILSPLISLFRNSRFLSELQNIDLFIIIGHPLVKALLPICLPAYSIKKMLRKPTLLFPFSITLNPFSRLRIFDSIVRYYIKNSFRNMDALLLRERHSMQYLQNGMSIRKNVILSADTAFLLTSTDKSSTSRKLHEMGVYIEKPAIAVAPRGDCFTDVLMKEKYEAFVCKMASLLDEVMKELNANIYFTPTAIHEDLYVINDIRRLMKHKDNTWTINTSSMDPTEVKTVLSFMDFLITMRLHAGILAADAYIPSVVIMPSYDLKSVGVIEDIGLSDYFVSLESPQMTTRHMLDNVLSLHNHLDDQKNSLKERIPKLQRRAELAGKTLKCFI